MTGEAVRLLALLFAAHFLGDFTPLASRRIQEAKAVGRPFGPIAQHAAVHGILAGLAVIAAARPGLALMAVVAGIVFVTHLGIDWLRGRIGGQYPALSDPTSQLFWSALGVDQLAHSLVLIGIAVLVL